MHGGFVAHVRNANEQEEPFLGDNKCLNDEGLTPTKDGGTCLIRLSMFRKEVH